MFLARRFPALGLAQDEAPKFPRAALPSARGGARDQDPDDPDVRVASSPTEATYQKLFQFLTDRLSPDDIEEATSLVQQLFSDTSDGGAPGMAGDSRPGFRYSQRYPHANRLHRKLF
jgi:hypothetical protein